MTDSDSSSEDSTGYVHDPEIFHERDDAGEAEDDGPRTTKAYLDGSNRDPSEQEFGRRGWILVGMLFVAFVVVPATILYLPQARPVIASLGLTYRDAYLVLPLVPALVLGAMAVWVAVGSGDQTA